MYVPTHFSEQRPEELARLISHNALGALVTHGPNGLDANHLPFELHGTAGAGGAHEDGMTADIAAEVRALGREICPDEEALRWFYEGGWLQDEC